MIIGLMGKSGSGKDATASWLCTHYGFARLAFADPLKLGAKHIFSLNDSQLWGAEKDVVDPFWGMTPAQILQRMGTECMRDGFSTDLWVKALLRQIVPGDHTVITDVRFPNEAQAVLDWGGVLVRVVRPGYASKRAPHASETALDNWPADRKLVNSGTITDLRNAVDDMLIDHTIGSAA